ncbi:flagellar basal body P-ring biosynthesis protein FlgA [Cohnella kolymensis]|uniref:Flagellar basal body P-ring biosynthesis protein FlgA n=1 Tax=Cohnella kolymensis TaxID=1590652 RepID=A0ABR5A889_9BACL|nr:SAF domain-containing protein [Cohnella kolymensis]KIL36888.1 flagellar basal body P-ring biosynthesis protein FlgA [Cohnella kolymensis]
MNRRRQITISISAAVISGLLVYGVYLLQLRQIKLQQTIDVVAPKQFIETGTILSKDHLKVIQLPGRAVTPDMVRNLTETVGMETSVPLGGNEPLLKWKVDKYRLLPRTGESTFQIPREYVKSISNGIRAGDEIAVYLSDEAVPSKRLFADPIRVAGVKTAANLEIDNPKNPNLLSLANNDKEGMYASRRDANGTIDSINLNLTEEQWLLMDSACKGGTAKLVIAYQTSAIQKEGE